MASQHSTPSSVDSVSRRVVQAGGRHRRRGRARVRRVRPRRGSGAGRGARRRRPPSRSSTLEQKPIEQASEFIATLRSLRSTTVQPEVDGLVTRIFVKSGDHVSAGAPLVQINAGQAAGHRVEHRGQPRRHRSRRPVLAPAGQAAGVARRRRRDQQAGVRPGAELAAHGRGAPGRRSTRRCSEGRVELEYYRVDAPQAGVGRRHRHPRRRSRDDLDRDHDHRRRTGARGLHPGSARPLAGSPPRPAGAAARLATARSSPPTRSPSSPPRVDDATQTVLVKSLAAQGAAVDPRPAVRARPHRLAEHAGPDGAGDRGRRGSAASTSASSPNRAAGRPGRAAAADRRSASWSATTTSCAAASRPARRWSSRASRRSATARRCAESRPDISMSSTPSSAVRSSRRSARSS